MIWLFFVTQRVNAGKTNNIMKNHEHNQDKGGKNNEPQPPQKNKTKMSVSSWEMLHSQLPKTTKPTVLEAHQEKSRLPDTSL